MALNNNGCYQPIVSRCLIQMVSEMSENIEESPKTVPWAKGELNIFQRIIQDI